MEEDNKTETTQPTLQLQPQTQVPVLVLTQQAPLKPLVRKFELEVYEEDLESTQRWKKVRYDLPIIVEVTSQKELQDKLALYKDCGQVAKIVREIDPPTKELIAAQQQAAQQQAAQQQAAQQQAAQCIKQPHQQSELQNLCNRAIEQFVRQGLPSQLQAAPLPVQVLKPKYYKVGDIEIKDDNGKIYQKQWMKLTDVEASNFRLVNDKNNAIVNMNGKHLEMKKWILVLNSEEDESTQLEENMK